MNKYKNMGIETPYIWKNGALIDWSDAKDHHMNHSLHYGGGVFEGIRFYNTSEGPKVFKLEEHIDRLFYSANYLSIKVPYTKHQIIQATLETVEKSGESAGYIRPIIYPSHGKMGLNPSGAHVDVCISVWKWGKYLSDDPINVKISKTRRIHPATTDMGAKITGNYQNSIVVSNEIKEQGYHEGLLLDTEGYIAEGPGENIFFVKGNDVYTPKLGTILPGITRDTIINFLKDELGIQVQECLILPEHIDDYDEAFFVGTAAEVTPIGSITSESGDYKKEFSSGDQESLTQKVKHSYTELVTGKLEAYKKFLS